MKNLKHIKRQIYLRLYRYLGVDLPKAQWCLNIALNILKTNYKLFEFSKKDSNRVIVYLTDKTICSGLADRIKTIIHGYALSIEYNRKFCLYHNKSFLMEDYLEPNEIDWRCNPNEISWGLNRVAFMFSAMRWIPITKPNKEYHIYQSSDILLNNMPEGIKSKYKYHELFAQLFKLSPRLDSMLKTIMKNHHLCENDYIAVHIRFMNFFEHFETGTGYDTVAQSEEEKERMIRRVHSTIDTIRQKSKCQTVLLFSDSNYFLRAEHPPYIITLPGTIGHSHFDAENKEATDKTFIDLMAMSYAKEIYSLTGAEVYMSGFPKTAAAIGNKPFHRASIEDE